MGTLIPNGFDQEIIAKLNTVFSGANFAALKAAALDADNRNAFSEDSAAKYPKRLSRAARRIGAYPDKKAFGGRKPRARWYVFLDKLGIMYDVGIDPAHPGAARSTEVTIKNLISDALQNQWNGVDYTSKGGIIGIVFSVGYDTPQQGVSPTAYVEPSNDGPPGLIYEIPGKKKGVLLSINLVVQDYITSYGVPDKPAHPNNRAKDDAGQDIETTITGIFPGDEDNH